MKEHQGKRWIGFSWRAAWIVLLLHSAMTLMFALEVQRVEISGMWGLRLWRHCFLVDLPASLVCSQTIMTEMTRNHSAALDTNVLNAIQLGCVGGAQYFLLAGVLVGSYRKWIANSQLTWKQRFSWRAAFIGAGIHTALLIGFALAMYANALDRAYDLAPWIIWFVVDAPACWLCTSNLQFDMEFLTDDFIKESFQNAIQFGVIGGIQYGFLNGLLACHYQKPLMKAVRWVRRFFSHRFAWSVGVGALAIHTFAVIGFACAWHGGVGTPEMAVRTWTTLSGINAIASPLVRLSYQILTLAIPSYSGRFHNIILALSYTLFGGMQWFVIFGKFAGYTRAYSAKVRKSVPVASSPFDE